MATLACCLQHQRSGLASAEKQNVHEVKISNAEVAMTATKTAKTLSVHFGVEVRKKRVVQAPYHFRHFIFLNHKSQINFRRSLRNHANFLVCQLAKYQRGHA